MTLEICSNLGFASQKNLWLPDLKVICYKMYKKLKKNRKNYT